MFISSASGTENLIRDAGSSARADDLKQKAVLYSKGTLILGGGGILTVEDSYKHGIYSDGYIRITGGELIITA